MSRVLLADFGSTRIKLLLWDRCTGLVDREERPGAVPIRSDGGRFETSPEFYWRTLESAVGELFRRSAAHASGSEPDSLWFCTEMHGFLLADRHGSPLSPYIGWQDQRAARTACGGERSTLDLMRPAEQNFRALTGMRLRPGLPWLNLADMVRRGEVPETAERILTLPDWILMRGGCTAPKSDPTMAAGTGFYDLTRGTWSRELLDEASSARTNCIFTEIAPTGTMLGVIRIAGRTLKTYGGTGDMLTALHGAGFGSERRAAINLGTGSQTAYMGNDEPDAPFEMRPTCENTLCRAITHIPGGKVLAMLATMFDGFARQGNGTPFFWNLWKSLAPEEILQAVPIADLNMFEGAWRYREEGGRIKIRNEWLSPRAILAGIAKSWIEQYADALRLMGCGRGEKAVVSGGMMRHSPFFAEVLSTLTGMTLFTNMPATQEDSFEGLLRLLENK